MNDICGGEIVLGTSNLNMMIVIFTIDRILTIGGDISMYSCNRSDAFYIKANCF